MNWLESSTPGIEPVSSHIIVRRSTLPAARCPKPATQSSAAAWKMSVPTIFGSVSGKTSTITRPKNVPLPTEVRPTTNPQVAPSVNAISLSRRVIRNGASSGWIPRLMNVLATRPMPPITSAAPIA